jgi:hypothetical protein
MARRSGSGCSFEAGDRVAALALAAGAPEICHPSGDDVPLLVAASAAHPAAIAAPCVSRVVRLEKRERDATPG